MSRKNILLIAWLVLALVNVVGHFSFLRPVPERVSVEGREYGRWERWCRYEAPSGFSAQWP